MTTSDAQFPTSRRKSRPRRRRIASLVAYDGAAFHGFQRQPGQRTVEGEIVEALLKMDLTGGLSFASRTDTGVHAAGQVVCFNVDAQTDLTSVTHRLRDLLPADIQVRALLWAPARFHPRWSATGKRYSYSIRWSDPDESGFPGERCWRLPQSTALGLEPALEEIRSAPHLTGFTAPGAPLKIMPPLSGLDCELEDGGLRLIFKGRAFGRYAIRHMVGCAVAQAQGQVPEGTCAAMATRQEAYRGQRAPACGLVLERVFFPPEIEPFGNLLSDSQ